VRIVPKPLTPNEIRQRELPRSLRGYREAETRQLIEEAAAAYEAALADLGRARESVSRRERDLEAALKALATAERAAEKMVVEAKQETAAILAEARATAEKMTAEAQAVRDELAPERESMVEQAQAEAASIRRAAEQQVEALREEQERLRSSIESIRGQFVALVEEALARLERPPDGQIVLVEDLTSRVSAVND
jgi:cell division septum initiation protein DivIVA